MYKVLSTLILEYRKAILIVTLVLGLMCAACVPFLQFNFTPQQLFESSSTREEDREEVAREFGREDNLLTLIIQGPDIYAPEALTYVHKLSLSLKQVNVELDAIKADGTKGTRTLQAIKRAESLTTLELPRATQDQALTTVPLAKVLLEAKGQSFEDPNVTLDAEIAAKLKAMAEQEPLLMGRVVDKKGELTTVLLWIQDEVQNASDLERVDEAIQAQLERLPPPPGYTVKVGGIPKVRVDVVRDLRREQLTFIPLTGLAYLIVLLLLFRAAAGAILPLGTVVLAVLATVALMVITGYPLNIINNILPPMIFIIGISDSIHMLTRQAEERELGLSHMAATKAMIRNTGAACLLTSTTTAVGFFSLFAADTNILKAFGWQAGFGVMFAYAATLFFLPAALVYFKPIERIKAKQGDQAKAPIDPLDPAGLDHAPILERGIVGLGRKVLAHPYISIIGGLVITGVFVFYGLKVEIDTTLLEIYHEDHPTYQTTLLLEQQLGGILPVEIVVKHPDRDHFKEPGPFAKLHAFEQRASAIDGVLSTQSMVDFHQAARVGLLGDPAQRQVMPDSREQIEQLQTLIEGPPDSNQGVRAYVTSDFKSARTLLRVQDFGAKRMIVVADELKAELNTLFPAKDGYKTIISGDAYVASISLDSFVRDLFYSLLLAMVIIFGMMAVVFRSLKVGLISIIPNVTPLVATLGYMGFMGIDLNTTTIIIFAISLGLAVDDTIHFLARFREESEQRETTYDALIYTYFGAGRAIMLTSVMLVMGLLVLMFSDFKPSSMFAKLTAITIGGALLGDLFILPPVLLLAYRKRKPTIARVELVELEAPEATR